MSTCRAELSLRRHLEEHHWRRGRGVVLAVLGVSLGSLELKSIDMTNVHHSYETIEHIFLAFIAGHLGGYVVDELGEVCHFEDFVGSDELQSLNSTGLESGGSGSVGESSTS